MRIFRIQMRYYNLSKSCRYVWTSRFTNDKKIHNSSKAWAIRHLYLALIIHKLSQKQCSQHSISVSRLEDTVLERKASYQNARIWKKYLIILNNSFPAAWAEKVLEARKTETWGSWEVGKDWKCLHQYEDMKDGILLKKNTYPFIWKVLIWKS